MSDLQIPEALSQPVVMIYLEQKIGSGEITIAGPGVTIDTPFEWPPEAIAVAQGVFHLELTSDKTCSVKASYPGLLAKPIDTPVASYFTILIGARPQYNITTPSGDLLVFGSTGPFGDPEKVTGYQLGIQEKGRHPLSFNFHVVQ